MAFDDLGVWQLLAGMDDTNRLSQFVADTLGSLLHTRDGIHLMRTLEAYLDAGGGHLAAAKVLAVHPNTVKYRVEKVRELLGYETLDDPVRRLGLHVALKGYHLLNPPACDVRQKTNAPEATDRADLSSGDKVTADRLSASSIASRGRSVR